MLISFQPPAMCRVANQQTRLPRATSSLALNACRDGVKGSEHSMPYLESVYIRDAILHTKSYSYFIPSAHLFLISFVLFFRSSVRDPGLATCKVQWVIVSSPFLFNCHPLSVLTPLIPHGLCCAVLHSRNICLLYFPDGCTDLIPCEDSGTLCIQACSPSFHGETSFVCKDRTWRMFTDACANLDVQSLFQVM